ncbi:MAG TPA: hypothetical protein DEB40_02415 [Elusimicrobia bacterium]|nr:hypothetical protein [Elusimicrobiota bacterium]HBT60584.1 hypothetical protein [Elusimicrobiota bacterium]
MTSEQLRMLAALMEIELEFLEECVRCGAVCLEEQPESGPELTPAQLARLRRLQRLCRSLDIDVFAGCIIVDLLDRMDELQSELQRRRGRDESSFGSAGAPPD